MFLICVQENSAAAVQALIILTAAVAETAINYLAQLPWECNVMIVNHFRQRRLRQMVLEQRQKRQAKIQAEADKKAQEQLAKENAAKQALATASEIKDSGRATDVVNDTSKVPVKDPVVEDVINSSSASAAKGSTSATPAASSSPVDDLAIYVNNMRNRRNRKGATLPSLSSTLGQGGILGV